MRSWEGDYAVYNRLSGDTHVLDVVTGEVFRVIRDGPKSTEALCRHLAGFLEVPNDERVASTVSQLVAHLDDIGLIEPVTEC